MTQQLNEEGKTPLGVHAQWHDIDKSILSYGGRFYPADARLQYRAAGTVEIRAWTSVGDAPSELYNGLNDILSSCFRGIYWKKLKECDRFKILLLIHDASFVEPDKKFVIKTTCKESTCKHKWNAEIYESNLQYTIAHDSINKYFNDATNIFEIQTKTFGTIKWCPPSLGVVEKITNWVQRQEPEFVKRHSFFIDMLVYLMHDHELITDKSIDDMFTDYSSWSKEKIAFMYDLYSNKGKIALAPNAKVVCPVCKAENKPQINFDESGGLKSFFLPISDFDSELL